MRRDHRHIDRIAAGILAAILFVFGAPPSRAGDALPFELRIAEGGEPVLQFPAAPGDRFTLSWVHSVEDEAWEEIFEIAEDGAIEIHSTRFKTYGAGVPSEGAETTRIEDGWVVMEGIDRIVDPLAVLATPKQTYRLMINGQSFDLTPDGKPHVLTFDVVDRKNHL